MGKKSKEIAIEERHLNLECLSQWLQALDYYFKQNKESAAMRKRRYITISVKEVLHTNTCSGCNVF